MHSGGTVAGASRKLAISGLPRDKSCLRILVIDDEKYVAEALVMFALLAGESGVPKLLLPVVEEQRRASAAERSRDPLAAIIEVIWAPAHEQSAIATSEVQQRVNVLLQARGEKLAFFGQRDWMEAGGLRPSSQSQRKGNGSCLRLRTDSGGDQSRNCAGAGHVSGYSGTRGPGGNKTCG